VHKNPFFWLVIFAIITVFAILIVWPSGPTIFGRKSMRLGLDLKGGVQLTYSLDTSNLQGKTPEEAKKGVIDVINRRINTLGVAEPVIQSTEVGGKPGVMVELPGVSETEKAKELIGQTAQLVFKEMDSSNKFVATKLTGAHLKKANATMQQGKNNGNQGFQSASPMVELTFDDEGAKLFKEITQKNLQKPVAIELDGQVLSAPTVQTVIEDGQAVITGLDSIQEAKDLSILLNAGALPVPINLESENKIGATLGLDSIESSLMAGILGIILICIFMFIYYKRAGFLAVIALGVYGIISLAIFKLVPITLTLAGLAGFIFSVGAAVDANVLVFERLKEEIEKGKEINTAIEESFKRSWSSIWPSNVASLITAAILYYGTTGMVRGFAVTLAIGILVSMFTAITVTRTLLRIWGKSIKKVTI